MIRYARNKHCYPTMPKIREDMPRNHYKELEDRAIADLQYTAKEFRIVAVYAHVQSSWRLAGVCLGKSGKMVFLDYASGRFTNPTKLEATHWISKDEIRRVIDASHTQDVSLRIIRR